MKKLLFAVGVLIAAGAWVKYADHPTAKNLRKALWDTFQVAL